VNVHSQVFLAKDNQELRAGGRIMKTVWSLVEKASKGVRKGLSLLVARVKALRRAVRADNFRLAQRLRMGLVLYLRHLKQPLRNDVARLFEVSGLWVRNIGDRHDTKRNIQRISRRIIQRLHPFVAYAPSLLVEEAPIK
jgi:hypothetical protein